MKLFKKFVKLPENAKNAKNAKSFSACVGLSVQTSVVVLITLYPT